MCILFIYADPEPPKGGYRLIVASNRDEYYKRPAKVAFHCHETDIIGGRDMEPGREGGMWLGISIKKPLVKFGALLNVTGEERRQATSGRGPLVYNYLNTPASALEYIKTLDNENFSAFNLLMIEVGEEKSATCYFSNSPEATYQYHGKQILAFGNSTPDKPFTKVKYGKTMFEAIVRENKEKKILVTKLIELLKCEELHLPDAELERRAPAGVNFLSSIFVNMKVGGYGTRTHSIILVDSDGSIEFVEHTMKEPINSDNPEWNISVIKSQL